MSDQRERNIEQEQQEYWDEAADLWAKWGRRREETVRPSGEALLFEARLRPGYRVLDVATGSGEAGLTAARHVFPGQVTGIDFSRRMVDLANAQAAAEGRTNYRAEYGTGTEVKFPNGTFDSVICRMGIMFFPNPKESLAEMIRVLKPGGRLALAVWSLPKKNPWISFIAHTTLRVFNLPAPGHHEPSMFRFADPSELLEWGEALGLKDLVRREVQGEVRYDSGEHYWEVMSEMAMSVHRRVKGLAEDKLKAYRAAVIEDVSDVFRGGPAHLGTSAWLIAGTKPQN